MLLFVLFVFGFSKMRKITCMLRKRYNDSERQKIWGFLYQEFVQENIQCRYDST